MTRMASTAALDPMVGRWITDGHLADTPGVRIQGTDTYVQLPGGCCLIHYVDVRVGDAGVHAIELITGRPDGDGFTARAYEGTGEVTVMELTALSPGVWRFTGGADVAPAARSGEPGGDVRSTLKVGDSAMTALWERDDAGAGWCPWMVVEFTRDDPGDEREAFAAAAWTTEPAADAPAELRRLAPLAGRWRWSGRSRTSEFAVEGVTDLRWLSGGRVLAERASLTSAGATNESLAVTRWDPDRGACVADYVDNDGNAGHYRIGLDGDRLTIDWPDFRFTGALRDDLIAGTWELRESGGGWAYWYDATLSRIEHGGASTPL